MADAPEEVTATAGTTFTARFTPPPDTEVLRVTVLQRVSSTDRRYDHKETVITAVVDVPDAGPASADLTLPVAEPSCRGGLVEVTWTLGWVITDTGGAQRVETVPLQVLPCPAPPEDATERAAALVMARGGAEHHLTHTRTRYDRVWSLVWGAGVAALALPALLNAGDATTALPAALLLGVVVGAARWFVPRLLKPSLPVPAWPSPPVLAMGETLSLTLQGGDAQEVLQWALVATHHLDQFEDIRRKGVASKQTVMRYREDVRAEGQLTVRGATPLEITIPHDGPSQVVTDHRSILWSLRLSREASLGREASVSLPLVVAPWQQGTP